MNPRRLILPDLFITIPALLLLVLGVLVIYTSDAHLAIQQLVVAMVGLGLYWLISLIDHEFFYPYVKYAYFFSLLLLLVVFLLGVETRGSLRWIPLGPFKLQPSELVKPVLIIVLAKFWSKNLPNWRNIFKSLIWTAPAVALVFKQPDLGTTVVLAMIWMVMLVAANVSLKKLSVLGLASFLLTPAFWLFLKDYQRVRLASFLYPEKDPLGLGYNVIQSTIAVGSGQLFGRGLGRGTQSRLQFLPEFRTDFIFASIAEEFGFLGSVIVLGLYFVLLSRIFKIASLSKSRGGMLLLMGVAGMFFVQVIVNIGMNIGILPITGITLPLLSYGGSSLLGTLISLGLVASVARIR